MSEEKLNKKKISGLVAIISSGFTIIIALLLIINYFQISSGAPLDSKVIDSLIQRISSEPDKEELLHEIRQLDLLARKAYFNSLWQIRTLSYIMLFSAIVFVISGRIYFSLSKKAKHELLAGQNKNIFYDNKKEFAVLLLGIAIVIPAFFSSYFTSDFLDMHKSETKDSATKTDEEVSIERIEISSKSVLDPEEKDDDDKTIADADADTLKKAEDEPVKEIVLTESLIKRNHNSFRGPFGNSISYKSNIPVDWDVETGKNILWKTEIPIHGYNSPVLWGNRLFLTGANEEVRVVYCIDNNTGKILWEQEVKNIPGSPSTPPSTTDDTGLAAPTACTDGERVYAIFGTGDIVAYDFEGNQVWGRNLGVPANHYGHSSSLLVWDNKVFVQYDTQRGSRIIALDTKTGNTVWETPRVDDVSWGSPLLAKVDGTYRLFLLALPGLSSYNITTGEQIWYLECMSGEVGTSPAYGDGLIFAANEYAKMVAVDAKTGEQLWEDNYYLPEVSSPVYYKGYVYIATSYAVVACFDAKNGELMWEFDAQRGFYSSPIIADGKLFVFDRDGYGYIFEAGNELKLIEKHNMGEPVYASPVFDDNRIYIRGNKHLFCINIRT